MWPLVPRLFVCLSQVSLSRLGRPRYTNAAGKFIKSTRHASHAVAFSHERAVEAHLVSTGTNQFRDQYSRDYMKRLTQRMTAVKINMPGQAPQCTISDQAFCEVLRMELADEQRALGMARGRVTNVTLEDKAAYLSAGRNLFDSSP